MHKSSFFVVSLVVIPFFFGVYQATADISEYRGVLSRLKGKTCARPDEDDETCTTYCQDNWYNVGYCIEDFCECKEECRILPPPICLQFED